MNLFHRKKKKMEGLDLTYDEMVDEYSVLQFEREKFHSDSRKKALELDAKRRGVKDYVR